MTDARSDRHSCAGPPRLAAEPPLWAGPDIVFDDDLRVHDLQGHARAWSDQRAERRAGVGIATLGTCFSRHRHRRPDDRLRAALAVHKAIDT